MGQSSATALVLFLVLWCPNQVISHDSDHRFSFNDSIPLYANKVGPIFNPSETHTYYDYPFCYPDHEKEKKQSFGETLNGDRLVPSPYKFNFLIDNYSQVACSRNLTIKEVRHFRLAVAQDYYLQLYYDDLPIWIFYGETINKRYLLYTYVFFAVFYNKDRVIEVHARTNQFLTVDITEDKEVEIEFGYTVNWIYTNGTFDRRMENALSTNRLKPQWLSLIDSCLPLLMLFAFVMKLYKWKLKKDIDMHAKDAEFGENQDGTGWKSLHGDVFRPPMHKSLFAAVVGCGTQLVVLTLLIILLAVLGIVHPYSRGAFVSTMVILYAVTSGIAGYSAISLYSQLEGTNWIKTLLLTTFIFLGPLLVTFGILNTVAVKYRSTVGLPLKTISALFCIWFFVGLPLMLMGGIFGKYVGSRSRPPFLTNKCPREVPRQSWHSRLYPRMAIDGIVLFYATKLELEYVLATQWSVNFHNSYPFLLVVFIVLLVLISLFSVIYTYIRLSVEDHKWWWRSFINSGAFVLYIFGYCVYFFYQLSNMSGILQTTFFFGYTVCACYGLFLLLGAVGFYSSFFFVHQIYRAIKYE